MKTSNELQNENVVENENVEIAVTNVVENAKDKKTALASDKLEKKEKLSVFGRMQSYLEILLRIKLLPISTS